MNFENIKAATRVAFGMAIFALPCSSSVGEGLKKAYSNNFPMGVAIPGPELSEAELSLLSANFMSITPENLMKPEEIHPKEGLFQFEAADRFVEFSRNRGFQVHGHTLVWHSQCPAWFFRDGNGKATRERVLMRMREHITAIVGRYRGRIARWDVVNEAIDDGNDFLRSSSWSHAAGEDFIVEAFRAARLADPEAKLYYNDYSIEQPAKREKALRLIRMLKTKGVPIDGIGIQGHWEIDRVPFDDIERSIKAFHAEGLRVGITELDIDVVPRNYSGADISATAAAAADLYSNGCPPEILARQAEQYAKLFQLFKTHADKIAVVTFWGLHDGRSWLNAWPNNRTNHPLLWDRCLAPKPALESVLRVAKPEAPQF